MVRKATQQANAAKMYRHFAAITVAATAALAIVTSDHAPATSQAATEPRPILDKPYGQPKLARRASGGGAGQTVGNQSWGSDEAPAEPLDFGHSSSVAPGPDLDPGIENSLTAEELARMTPAQREQFLREQAARQAAVSETERREQIRRISEASLARSGASDF